MFAPVATAEEAAVRSSMEPLVEMNQHKGDSECRTGFQSTDELCGFEKLNRLQLFNPVSDPNQAFPPLNYVRNALKEGLAQEQQLGVNPFKLGLIGSTDTHNATPGATEEQDFGANGHLGLRDHATPAFMLARVTPAGIEATPGGLAVVWAEENSRDALFAAMRRREVYGTSGTRPILRFFGGRESNLRCRAPDFVATAYAGGVPMGGEIGPVRGGRSPRFGVLAFRDPGTPTAPGTPLQRVQIVKGWVDAGGQSHEKVFEVAGNPENGAAVDTATCAPSGTGFDSLCAVWSDPEFKVAERAFYYARVLENPTLPVEHLPLQRPGHRLQRPGRRAGRLLRVLQPRRRQDDPGARLVVARLVSSRRRRARARRDALRRPAGAGRPDARDRSRPHARGARSVDAGAHGHPARRRRGLRCDHPGRHAATGSAGPIGLERRHGEHRWHSEPSAPAARSPERLLPAAHGPTRPVGRGSRRPLHRGIAARRHRRRHHDAPLALRREGPRHEGLTLRRMRWLQAPLLHFLAGGAALFWWVHGANPPTAPVVVTARDVSRLRLDYTRETGLEPTSADEAALVEKAIEEELLVREALARGLDRNDRSVRNWLVEQMRVLSDDTTDDSDRLYARARVLGLDRTDLVVRRILVQKMRLLAARTGERPPSDADLEVFYADHRNEYRPP